MATYYWVGGAGTWNDFSNGHWSLTSGGSNGAGPPTLADNAIFDANSGGSDFTVTLQSNVVNPRCYNLTVSRPTGFTITFNGANTTLEVYGPTISIGAAGAAGIAFTGSNSPLTCLYNGVGTFLCTPSHRYSPLTFSGAASSWTLGSNLTGGNSIVVAGSFDTSTSNYSISATTFTSSNTNTRTLTFNASNITLSTGFDVSTSTNLTVNGGTAIFYMGGQSFFRGGGKTYYRIEASAPFFYCTVTGANTFTQFYIPGRSSVSLTTLSLENSQTIGTLTLNASAVAGARHRIQSTSGSPITLTVGTFSAADDLDFYNITVAGAASPISGTRFGNCGGNTGITFPAAKTVYWSSTSGGSWSNATWALTSGGAGSAANFPLAQDTVIFDALRPTSGGIVFDDNWAVGTINLSARVSGSSPMTLSGIYGVSIYGNWIGGSGITQSAISTLTFAGDTSATLSMAGALGGTMSIDKDSGASVTLQDTLTASGTKGIGLGKGTFNVNGQTVTYNGFSSTGTSPRSLVLGSGTLRLNNTDSGLYGSSTGLTITSTAGGKIAFIGNGNPNIIGGGATFGCIVSIEANVTLTIYDSNTFNTLQSTATGCTVRFSAATTNTFINDFALLSNGGTVTLSCATGGLTYTLSKATGTVVVKGCTISGSNAAGGATWLAPTSAGNVDGGTNTGWSFITGTVYSDAVTEAQTSIDSPACSLRYDASITENNSIADNDDANLAFPVSVTEGQTIADSDSVTDYWAVINTTQSANWTPIISI